MNKKWIILFIVLVISGLLHYKDFSKDLMGKHAWRQTQTQSTIRNFYAEDMNILNPRQNERFNGNGIFRMEFPLMQWLVAVTNKITGYSLIITRLWMFIIGLFTIAGMYQLLFVIFKNCLPAMMGAWAFSWSPDFFYYTINPLPDNLALCFSVWGISFFFSWCNNRKLSLLVLSSLLLSLGVLCKLPFILYFSVPLIYFTEAVIKKDKFTLKIIRNIFAAFIFILFPLAWYIFVIPGWKGNGIVQGIFENKTSLFIISGYIFHNVFSTLPELLLNYAAVPFFIMAFYFFFVRKSFRDQRTAIFVGWASAIVAYFLFEINMIEDVHDYYLFPFYPLLFILVGYGAYHVYRQKTAGKYITIILLMLLPFTAWLRNKNSWNEDAPGFNKDLLIYKNDLQNAVPSNALCVAGNDVSHNIFFYYLDKKGWTFDSNNYDASKLTKAINTGAEYLYSDSRTIDENKNITQLLDQLILEKGSFRVYKLKKPK